MKKRVLAIAMSLAMTLSLLPVSALAAETGETPEEETQQSISMNELNENDVDITVDDDDVTIIEETQVVVGSSADGATISQAITNGAQEITLGGHVTEDVTIPEGVEVTIDLAGYTLTGHVAVKGNLTIEDSTASSEPSVSEDYGTVTYSSGKITSTGTTVLVSEGGTVILKSGEVESTGNIALFAEGDKTGSVSVLSKVVIEGGYAVGQEGAASAQGKGATVNVNGGVLEALDNAVVAGNGTVNASVNCGGTTINISDGIIIGHIQTQGYIACGVYHPQEGELNITGGTIYADGGVGILMRAGTADISGGKIVGSGSESTGGWVGDSKYTISCAGVVYDEKADYPGMDSKDQITISGNAIVESAGRGVPAVTVLKSDSADVQNEKRMVVSGGQFNTAVAEEYLPSGMTQDKDGNVVVDTSKAVASVNGVGYDDLQEAIENAGNSDTVKLLKETTSETPIIISEGQSFTLDLGGNVLTIQGTQEVRDVQAFGEGKVTQTAIVNNGTLTIANGTIITTADCNSITNTGTLEITQDTVLSNRYETYSGRNLIVNLGGTVMTAGQLTSTANNGICTYGGNIAVTGGTISATHYQDWSNCASGITIFNRSYDNNSTGATVTISGGTIEAAVYAASTNNVYSGGKSPSNLTITGGTLTATKSTAIYWPSAGTLTIGTKGSVGGPTINSERGSAVEICSGTLNVYGGTLNGGTKMTEGDSYPTNQDLVDGYRVNSGSAGTGDAVTVISRRGSGYATAPLTVNISGGTFNSPQNYGVRYMDCNLATTGTSEITQNVAVEIAGGNFDGGIAAVEAEFTKAEDKDFISGGSYSDSVSTYLTNEVNAELQRATGNTPFSYYKTIEEASANVQPGDTVTALNATTTDPCMVTINYGYGSNSIIQVASGTKISLPDPGTRTGYTFNGWYNGSSYVGRGGTEVTIASDITYTADWTRNQTDRPSSGSSGSSSDRTYSIDVDVTGSRGGSVTLSPTRASAGTRVTITVRPNSGYELDELTVLDEDGDEVRLTQRTDTTYTFHMPDGKVTVEASFVREGGQTQTPQTTFADVPASAWYCDAVEYVYENGLMSGVSGGRFAPDDTLTRAMLVQTLYAMEGRPAAASAGFADVASGDWYASAVNWAAANGVVSGVSETGFGPNNALTREQLALILYRFAQYKGYDVTGTSDLAAYADGSSVSGWAAEAMSWAVDAGLISGVGGNQIAPTGTATRAQVAQILMNFCENVAH